MAKSRREYSSLISFHARSYELGKRMEDVVGSATTYRNLKQTHVDELGANFDRLVQHLPHAIPDLERLRVGQTHEDLEEL